MRRKKIQYVVEGECFVCVSHTCGDAGYPIVRRGRKLVHIHRELYKKYHNCDLSSDQIVRHTCDNTMCINVSHMVLGTHQDNVRDRVSRGRSAKGVRHGRCKLTEDDVRMVRASTKSDRWLAESLSVSCRAISKIRARETWKHLD